MPFVNILTFAHCQSGDEREINTYEPVYVEDAEDIGREILEDLSPEYFFLTAHYDHARLGMEE